MPAAASVEGILLSAGSSSRAGGLKVLFPLGEKTMLEHAVEGMARFCTRIIVVTGHGGERVSELLAGRSGVECLHNPRYREGMFTSVKRGVAGARADRIFLLPADIPLVPARVFERLLSADAPVAVPVYDGRRGHPVLIGRSVVPEILREPDGSTLRAVLRRVGTTAVEVDAEEILLDADTPGDLRRLSRLLEARPPASRPR